MIRFRGKKGAFAILSVGRLHFHVTRYGATIGWQSDDYDYYYPSINADWPF